jgi:hypothetical protein
VGRHELTDDQWVRLALLVPPRFTGRRGHPFQNRYTVSEEIVTVATAHFERLRGASGQ